MLRYALLALILLISGLPARADVGALLGEDYKKADLIGKIVLICVARVDDKRVSLQQAELAINELVLAELRGIKDARARLVRLGELRSAAEARARELSKARRKEGKLFVGFVEPDNALQVALILSYVKEAAGVSPSLAELGCLKLVRESTTFTAHTNVVRAYVTDALHRDKTYSEGDSMARLKMIRELTDKRQVLSNFEALGLEQAVLLDWISASLRAGKRIDDILASLKSSYEGEQLSFFAYKWAKETLDRMAQVVPLEPGAGEAPEKGAKPADGPEKPGEGKSEKPAEKVENP